MTRILAIALAASAAMIGISTAEAHGPMGSAAGVYVTHHATPVAYRSAKLNDDEDDDEDDVSDNDDDDADENSASILVDDYEDCAPGKYRMVEMADIEVPVACH